MQYVVLGLLVVLVIGFFVVVWKAAQGWRWYNIVAVIFTMLLTVTFLFPTAGVLKSRSYRRTVAGTECSVDTQWRVPLTFRPSLDHPPRVSGS